MLIGANLLVLTITPLCPHFCFSRMAVSPDFSIRWVIRNAPICLYGVPSRWDRCNPHPLLRPTGRGVAASSRRLPSPQPRLHQFCLATTGKRIGPKSLWSLTLTQGSTFGAHRRATGCHAMVPNMPVDCCIPIPCVLESGDHLLWNPGAMRPLNLFPQDRQCVTCRPGQKYDFLKLQ
jgi:hypothetical protein